MTDYDRIEKMIKYLTAHQESQPDLATLAREAHLSKFHFHRLFTRWAGVTPKMFLKFITAARAKSLLRDRSNLLDVSYAVGLSGPGRLHDLLVTLEGVTPGEFKALGEGTAVFYGFHLTPFGDVLIGLTARGICHWHFLSGPEEKPSALQELRRLWSRARISRDQNKTKKFIYQIFNRADSKRPVPVFVVGTPFQLKVWEALLKIPSGGVDSYGALARSLGLPKAARAVGTAVASNPVGYLIPCHRVIRETGVIGQYRWGRCRKHALLFWEKARSSRDKTIE